MPPALGRFDQETQAEGVRDFLELQVDLGSDDGGEACAPRGCIESWDPVDAARIGQSQAGIAALSGPEGQILWVRGSFQEGKGAACTQFDIIGGSGGHAPTFALFSPFVTPLDPASWRVARESRTSRCSWFSGEGRFF